MPAGWKWTIPPCSKSSNVKMSLFTHPSPAAFALSQPATLPVRTDEKCLSILSCRKIVSSITECQTSVFTTTAVQGSAQGHLESLTACTAMTALHLGSCYNSLVSVTVSRHAAVGFCCVNRKTDELSPSGAAITRRDALRSNMPGRVTHARSGTVRVLAWVPVPDSESPRTSPRPTHRSQRDGAATMPLLSSTAPAPRASRSAAGLELEVGWIFST